MRRPESPIHQAVSGRAMAGSRMPVKIKTVAGDLTMAWTPRNKRLSYGCVSQEDANEYFLDSHLQSQTVVILL